MITFVPKIQQQRNSWSGGTTTQLWIWPENASYADRTFDIRISTATIDVPESVFSDLTGYTRHLMSLTETLTLFIDDLEPFELQPLTCFTFDGGSSVRSIGEATDFNVMLKPYFKATLTAFNCLIADTHVFKGTLIAIYCLGGSLDVQWDSTHQTMETGDFLVIKDEGQISIQALDASHFVLVNSDI